MASGARLPIFKPQSGWTIFTPEADGPGYWVGAPGAMFDAESGKSLPQHSNHPVPCMVIDEAVQTLAEGENLSSIAPTVLQLMGIEQPAAMTGNSVIADLWSKSS